MRSSRLRDSQRGVDPERSAEPSRGSAIRSVLAAMAPHLMCDVCDSVGDAVKDAMSCLYRMLRREGRVFTMAQTVRVASRILRDAGDEP